MKDGIASFSACFGSGLTESGFKSRSRLFGDSVPRSTIGFWWPKIQKFNSEEKVLKKRYSYIPRPYNLHAKGKASSHPPKRKHLALKIKKNSTSFLFRGSCLPFWIRIHRPHRIRIQSGSGYGSKTVISWVLNKKKVKWRGLRETSPFYFPFL